MANKKTFKNDPNALFISGSDEAPEATAESAAAQDLPIGYKIAKESKTRRLQLLIRPSVYTALKQLSEERGISFNELVNRVFEEYLEKVE